MTSAPDELGRYAWGVATLPDGRLFYYEKVDGWREERRPAQFGGYYTMRIRDGLTWHARVIGSAESLPVDATIAAIIDADQARTARKARGDE